jgi:hypothetical protein
MQFMAIEAMCLGCGKRYQLSDKLSGKRVKCKECGTAIDLPRIEEVQGFTQPAPTIEVPVAAQRPATDSKARLQAALAVLNRMRPRSLWMWAVAIIVLLLLVGFLSVNVAVFTFLVLGGLGVLALHIAVIWGAIIGLYQGSKAIVGALATATTAALGMGVIKLIGVAGRSTRRASETYSTSTATADAPWTTVALGLAIALGLIAIFVGFLKNPLAFRRPFHVFLVGGVLMGVCWIPMHYWKESSPPPAVSSRGSMPQGSPVYRPTPPPGMSPRQRTITTTTRPRATTAPTRRVTRMQPQAPSGTMQVKWGGSWWDARIIRKEEDWTLVEYTSDKSREWIEPWRMRDAGSKDDDLPHVSPNHFDTNGPAPDAKPRPKPAK